MAFAGKNRDRGRERDREPGEAASLAAAAAHGNVPPHDIEAERAVLGGVMLDNTALSTVEALVTPADFYHPAHAVIFEAIQALSSRREPVDVVTLSAELRARDRLNTVGGAQYLGELTDTIPTIAHIEQHARIVADLAQVRRMISVAHEIVARGFGERGSAEQFLDFAAMRVFEIAQKRSKSTLIPLEQAIQEAFERIEKTLERGARIAGLETGFRDLDTLISGLSPGQLIIVAARPAMGKCLGASSEILLEDGSIATIEEICRRRAARLLTLGEDHRFRVAEPSHFVDDGRKPLFRVTTGLGRSVETTLTHPFLTREGWKPLGEIRVGTRVAVPRRLAVFGDRALRDCEVKLLAYLIGGGPTGGAQRFGRTSASLFDEFARAVDEFCELRAHVERASGDDAIDNHARRPLTAWLAGLGLLGKGAREKFVPNAVFTLPRTQLALFLNRLFATGGWASVRAKGRVQVGYRTMSERLARQVQHLLLRFGVIAALDARSVAEGGEHCYAWQLEITDADSIRVFAEQIGIYGNEEGVAAAVAALEARPLHEACDVPSAEVCAAVASARTSRSWASLTRCGGVRAQSKVHAGRSEISLSLVRDDTRIEQLCESEIYWDEVVAIEYVGVEQVYDLTVPDTHNFVANDVCVHNTSFVLNITTHSAFVSGKPVLFFSLEMPRVELANRMMCAEARVDQGRLRANLLTQDDMTALTGAASKLFSLPIYIDDSGDLTLLELRSKARRVKNERDLSLIVIDYLQLMKASREGMESREREISEISRGLKSLAKELDVPIIALSQLNRSPETRSGKDKRPQLSDLRECVTGDTLVALADGRHVPIASLVGTTPEVIAMAKDGELVRATSDRVWLTGKKPVFQVRLASGRGICCTANHRLYGADGWRRLQDLAVGDHLAVARSLPEPATIARWSDTRAVTDTKDLSWDRIVSIEPAGEKDVYDLTVPGPASWIANSAIVSHNSGAIEQDADVVMFIYRDEVYNRDTEDKGIAEIIVAKQRNGPTDTVRLKFIRELTKFENLAEDEHEYGDTAAALPEDV